MVNAIATANTNLAGFDFGFGVMYPLLAPVLLVPVPIRLIGTAAGETAMRRGPRER